MSAKLIAQSKETSLEIKRLYLHGVKIEWDCPQCKIKRTHDFGFDYLSYPKINQEMELVLFCEECNENYEIKGKLNMSIELLSDEINKC